MCKSFLIAQFGGLFWLERMQISKSLKTKISDFRKTLLLQQKIMKASVLHTQHFLFGGRETWKVRSTEASHKLCEGVKSFTCMFRHSATKVKGAVTENSMGLWGTAQKYLVPTGKKAPQLSLLHIITFTFPAYTIYQSMFFSILFHVLSWERNLGSKLCSSHGESTGGVLCTSSIIHFHIVHPLWLGSILLHREGGEGPWQPPVLLDCFQQGCSTDIYATRNCAQASDGSLGFLKGNCTKIHFSHLQKFFAIFCHCQGILLCSPHRGRVSNIALTSYLVVSRKA